MKILVIMLAALLSGCATKPEPRTFTNTVEVPVPCTTKKPVKPASAVAALPLNAEIDEQMRALRADRVRGMAFTDQLEKALSSCE